MFIHFGRHVVKLGTVEPERRNGSHGHSQVYLRKSTSILMAESQEALGSRLHESDNVTMGKNFLHIDPFYLVHPWDLLYSILKLPFLKHLISVILRTIQISLMGALGRTDRCVESSYRHNVSTCCMWQSYCNKIAFVCPATFLAVGDKKIIYVTKKQVTCTMSHVAFP